MIWELKKIGECAVECPAEQTKRRFVAHRHCDDQGEHIDLRLEESAELCVGWRFGVSEAERLAEGVFGTLKPFHPATWLDVNTAECARVDSGICWYEQRGPQRVVVVFEGEALRGRFECNEVITNDAHEERRVEAFNTVARAACECLGVSEVREVDLGKLVRLVEDGRRARQGTVEELCGLGRVLEGEEFPEREWRALLEGLGLGEMERHAQSFRRRFDEKYPVQPLSERAVPQEDEGESEDGLRKAREILRT